MSLKFYLVNLPLNIIFDFSVFSVIYGKSGLSFAKTFPNQENAALSAQLLEVLDAIHAFNETSIEAASALRTRISSYSTTLDYLSIVESDTPASQRAVVVCNIAKLLYPQNIISPNSSQYILEQEYNWSETCWLAAACFIMVQDTFDVATVLKVITHIGAKFSIRSGGHNPNSGFGSVDKTGVLLDLRRLNSTALNTNGILSTGPGSTWGKLYNFLDSYNVSVQGGRHSSVGVGGYLLGGGMTFFPNLLGLGVDSIHNIEIVLANSSVVTANAIYNADLFYSIKGGGPNFGIITRFDIYTHSPHRVWYSLNLYAATDYKAILNATIQVQAAMDDDPKLGFFLNINPSVIIAGLLYAEWTTVPSGFAAFNNLTSVGAFVPETNGTISSLTAAINIGSNPARRESYAVSHAVDLNLYTEIQEAYLSIMNNSNMPSANLSYTIQPIGKAGVITGYENGGNALGLIPKAQIWHVSLVEWLNDSDDKIAHNAVNTLGSTVQHLAEAENQLFDFQFMNDASFTQQPLRSYGLSNFAKLETTRQLFDPDGVFQKLQNSGFLLSRMPQRG